MCSTFFSKANCCSASLFNVFVVLRLFFLEGINWYWKKSCFDLVERVWNYLFSREASCCYASPFCFRLSVFVCLGKKYLVLEEVVLRLSGRFIII